MLDWWYHPKLDSAASCIVQWVGLAGAGRCKRRSCDPRLRKKCEPKFTRTRLVKNSCCLNYRDSKTKRYRFIVKIYRQSSTFYSYLDRKLQPKCREIWETLSSFKQICIIKQAPWYIELIPLSWLNLSMETFKVKCKCRDPLYRFRFI